jgi:hypothetical protein
MFHCSSFRKSNTLLKAVEGVFELLDGSFSHLECSVFKYNKNCGYYVFNPINYRAVNFSGIDDDEGRGYLIHYGKTTDFNRRDNTARITAVEIILSEGDEDGIANFIVSWLSGRIN